MNGGNDLIEDMLLADLVSELPHAVRLQRLVTSLRAAFDCGAVALLRLDEDGLRPVAVDGLVREALGRRFMPAHHPRLAAILNRRDVTAFDHDSALPDPYDGLLDTRVGEPLPVHDCMGTSLHVDGQPWGVLTLDALRTGTFDQASRDRLRRCTVRVEAALRVTRLEQEVHALRMARGSADRSADAGALSGSDEIIGHSAVITALLRELAVVAGSDLPVLLLGETGVGKELFARALHDTERKGGPFVAFDCGAVTRELIAGELFGHVRGAFTGATNEGRAGRFEMAHGGTLCLDEIGEMPLDLQPVLLRALEEGVVYRLGDTTPRHIDVRLVAMTNRDLLQEVAAGRFRRDLYHRVSITQIQVPALREREGDVDMLVDHFVEALSARHGVAPRVIGPDVRRLLRAYPWPGNVRELRNVVECLLLTSDEEIVQANELPAEVRAAVGTAPPTDADLTRLEATERLTILQAIQRVNGNLAQAARVLGISRSTLYRKVELYHLEDVVKACNDGEH